MPNDTQKQTDPARSAAERIDSIAEDHHCHASIVEEAEAIIREEHVELHALRDAVIKWKAAMDAALRMEGRRGHGPKHDAWTDAGVQLMDLVPGVTNEQDAEPQA